MKSLEDLNLMSVAALEGVHLQLTGNKPKKGLSKSQLAQRVFDLQQPDAPAEDSKPKRGENDTQGQENNEDDFDDLTGGEPQGDADALSVKDDEDDLVGDGPAPEPVRPVKTSFPMSDKDANPKDVVKALAHTGVQVDMDEVGMHLRKGGRVIYTTLKQPLHRIVAIAENFVGVGK